MDAVTYAKSKRYTNDTAEEFGGLKGANCQIQSITPITGGNRITFLWQNSAGATQSTTMDVMNGADGTDGIDGSSVVSAEINTTNNHLILTMSDSTTIDCGEVPTVQGEEGKSAYEIAVEQGYSGTEEEWIASLKGDKGDAGEGVPTGGTTGQVLVKKSSTNYDTEWDTPAGGGDMLKSVYDTDNDGKVDSAENADTVDGHTVAKDVPADAKFTDTVYDDTEIRGEIADKVDKVDGKGLSTEDYTSAEKTKLSGIETGAEVNTIESISLNGVEVTPDANKNVALTVITKAVNDLVNYYLKSETYSKTEVDDIVTAIKNSRFEVVATLPTTDIKTNVIYLVPKSPSQTSNVKDEYINLDGTTSGWEKIGDTEIDLSDYVTTQALNTALADYTTTSDLTTLLAAKQDTLTFDNVPTENSNNPVKSNGVFVENRNIYEVMGKMGSKALLPMSLANIKAKNTTGTWNNNAYTINGVTFTVNTDSDGFITDIAATGTASADATLMVYGYSYTSAYAVTFDTPVIASIDFVGSDSTARGIVWGTNSAYIEATEIQVPAGTLYGFGLRVLNGYEIPVGGITFKPMIRFASDSDDTYQPYVKTNKELTAENEALANQVTDIYEVMGNNGAKNLLPFTMENIKAINTNGTWNGNSYTYHGITYVVSEDGVIEVSGTNNSGTNSVFYLVITESGPQFNFKLGRYKLNGCPAGGSDPTYSWYVAKSGQYNSDYGSGVTFEVTSETDSYWSLISVKTGTALEGTKTFKPMVRLASDTDSTYQPYAMTNQQITPYVQAISNPNLLDNPWFTVNQRGFSSKNDNGFTVDRWQILQAAGTVSLSNGVITIDPTVSGTTFLWGQTIENAHSKLAGKSVTLSVMLSDGTIKSKSFDYPTVSPSNRMINNVYLGSTHYFELYEYSSGHARVGYFNNSGVIPSAPLTIKAVKLEIGSVSTLAMDTAPNYATELLKCQRYFVRYAGAGYPEICHAVESSSTSAWGLCFLPVPMRTKPSVAFANVNAYRLSDDSATAITAMEIHALANNACKIMFTLASNGVNGAVVEIQPNSALNGYVDFSADL